MAFPWAQHVDRFCHQYLQLEPELDYPPDQMLRLAEVQDALYESLFAPGAARGGPPERYRAKTFKKLVTRIEAAIDDWNEHVSVSRGLAPRSAHRRPRGMLWF